MSHDIITTQFGEIQFRIRNTVDDPMAYVPFAIARNNQDRSDEYDQQFKDDSRTIL